MGLLPPVILELRAKASEVYSELGKVQSEMEKTASKTEESGSKMGRAMKGAGAAGGAITLGVVGAGVAIAGFSLEAAAASQVTEARLSTAIKNVGGNAEEFKPKMEKAADSVVKFGYTNNQGQQALANLTTALGDPKKAMADLGVAANLAREKNISLSQASDLVAKASEGQVRPLKSLGIDLPVYAGNAQAVALANQKLTAAQGKVTDILAKTPDAANSASKANAAYEKAVHNVTAAQDLLQQKQSSGDKIMATLSDRVKGQAAAYGDTLKGKIDSAKASLEGMGETIGGALIPVVSNMAKAGEELFTWLTKNQGVMITLGVVLGTVAGALVAVYVAQKVWTAFQAIAKAASLAWAAAQWIVNAAMDANPVMIIVLAIIALIAIIVLLITHWKQVSDFLVSTWQHVASFFVTVGQAIAKWWTGLWNSIVNFVTGLWKTVTTWVVNEFTGLLLGMRAIGVAISAWWNSLWASVNSFIASVWSAIVNGVAAFLGWVVNAFLNWTVFGIIISHWSAISSFFVGLWNGIVSFISGALNAITGTISGVGAQIGSIWNGIWSGLGDVVSNALGAVEGTVSGIMDGIIGAINGVIDGINGVTGAASAVGVHIGKIGHIPSFDTGGTIPGATGAPMTATVHGGEYMLSNDMLSGRRPISPGVAQQVMANVAAYSGASPARSGSSGAGISSTIIANTNATPGNIASALGWELRRQG